jgi:hypothetical protein
LNRARMVFQLSILNLHFWIICIILLITIVIITDLSYNSLFLPRKKLSENIAKRQTPNEKRIN